MKNQHPNKTILTEVGGFTPTIDVIVHELGFMTAGVFGRVWRYCQMKDGVCNASLETIGDEMGISEKTVSRHIKKLCKAGYLKDLTPGRRNRPHVYADTGKVRIAGGVGVETGPAQEPDPSTDILSDRSDILSYHSTDILSDEDSKERSQDISLRASAQNEQATPEKPKTNDPQGWKHRDRFREELLPLADRFALEFGAPSKNKLGFWLQDIRDLYDRGAVTDDFDTALERIAQHWTVPATATSIGDVIRQVIQDRLNSPETDDDAPVHVYSLVPGGYAERALKAKYGDAVVN